ncbi:SAM-dependent methyltransferase [Methanoregula sp.]|uniref:SAM-dependent methyltransferase n=1 Tax=Methanoregula sp. TaxID=2052170 RepID=UPI003C76A08D
MEQPDPGSIMYRSAGPSRTAEGVAAFRALESMLPEQDRICYDPYAIRFTSPARLASVVAHADTRFPGLRNTIVARVRFFDDTIKEAAQNGLEQLVIMGAGYDTRAYRIDELKENMRVFEIDRPGIQEIKKAKIRDIFGRLPDNVVYVAVDFEIQDFGQRLFECGYSHKKKTLFVMEGLIMYLTLPAIDAMLSFIVKNSGPGSAILFDCSGKTGSHDSMTRKKLEDHTAQSGEPIRFFLPEEGAEAFLVQRGFSQVRTVTCDECRQLYFQGKNNDRNLSRSSSFMYAIVE